MIRGRAAGIALCVLAGGALGRSAAADDMLTLYFHERAPYSARDADGKVHGITADIATAAMAKAGIPYHWEELPSARQIEVIRRNERPACGLGWFKRPEREFFAKFSAPIYRDLPTIVVARADDTRFTGKPTIDALFADKSLTLLTKTGYSYGAVIDAKIIAEGPNARADSSDNQIMLGMVSKARVDYMMMAEEEARDLLSHPDFSQAGLTIYHLANPPPGEYRYLLCSKSVSDGLLARINRAITPPE